MVHSISQPQKRAEKVPGVQEARDSAKQRETALMSLNSVRRQDNRGLAPEARRGEAGRMQGGDRLMTEPGWGQVPRRPGSAGAFPHRSVAGDSRTAGSRFAEKGGLTHALICPTWGSLLLFCLVPQFPVGSPGMSQSAVGAMCK